MMYKEVTKVECDTKELFSKRDEEGYIILDDKISEFTPESRERIGSEFRLKNWIETNDGKQFLVKSNNKMDDKIIILTKNHFINPKLSDFKHFFFFFDAQLNFGIKKIIFS